MDHNMEKINKIGILLIVGVIIMSFVAGFFVHEIISQSSEVCLAKPYGAIQFESTGEIQNLDNLQINESIADMQSNDNVTIFLQNTMSTTGSDTRSMLPWIDAGSTVLTKKVNSSDIKKNDIAIYYNSKGNAILHQAIEIRDNCIVMKGTNNIYDDGCIPKENFIEVVVGILFTKNYTPNIIWKES